MNLQGEEGDLLFEIEVTRAATGEKEKFVLVGKTGGLISGVTEVRKEVSEEKILEEK